MVLKKFTLIDKVVHVIAKEITRLKNADFTEDSVRKMIYNKCYIKNSLDIVQGFCSINGDDDKILRIKERVDQEINKRFYSKFNSKEYLTCELPQNKVKRLTFQ